MSTLVNSLLDEVRELRERTLLKGDCLDPLSMIVPDDIREKNLQGKSIVFHDLWKA